MKKLPIFTLLLIVFLMLTAGSVSGETAHQLTANPDSIQLPEGFTFSIYAEGIINARSMAVSPEGIVFVGSRQQGTVYALQDNNGDNQIQSDEIFYIARGLNNPNGIAYHDGTLYVAEINRILRYEEIDGNLSTPPAPGIVLAGLPAEAHHGWKYLRYGPDGKLYFQIGVPCDICIPSDPRFGTLMRVNPDGSGIEVYATGIRQSVGFDFQPESNLMWFTDNGRDYQGDDEPPDELNLAPQPGLNFGFPFCYGQNLVDPVYAYQERGCADFTPPAADLDAHVAALGMKFYTGDMFPEEYHNQIFIAEHGSVYRNSGRVGYRVMLVRVEGTQVLSYEPFATGWLNADDTYWGRPVDIAFLPDGSMLVSDDEGGRIYRIAYSGG